MRHFQCIFLQLLGLRVMTRNLPLLAAALCAGMLALLAPLSTQASPYAALGQAVAAPQSATLLQAGYYGGGDYYGDDQKSDDYDDNQKHDYYGGKQDYYGGGGYRHHYPKHHDEYQNGCCSNSCYKKEWVCEESVPRCFKQRECVWHYGREYCRYVRRCHGGGDRYCKWISVPSNSCGY
jgi:hypothetical protein